ncbi:phytanoyl-CoA dioxygenase family protein [uncultured Parasphingopyxis sp.]|uniref:phytanoyl-CoA dioxygenase family protein n=2 Tax=Parasphingopyxis TaxID=1234545 RepID=UPI0026114E11|nr:phytanoyl-CoA dioxygenase family protein [uncultured Parasphingopyxis sp.]
MNPARYLLAPVWLAQLATGAKNFSKNPVIGSRRLNARGLHAWRVKRAHAMAARRRTKIGRKVDAEDRAAFDRDGFVEKRDFLPADAFEKLRASVFTFTGPAREMVQGDTITRRIALDPKALKAVPELAALLDRPDWRWLIRYAGSFDQEPLLYIQSIVSHAHDGDPDPQTHFHADTFHPTVKAWFFLTDVAEDEGPFCYVPGSHRLTPERLAWEREMSVKAVEGKVDRLSAKGSFRVSEDELPALGLPAPRKFAVPANTLVVGDTFGFHARGPSARPSVRVEIWAYGRRNPFLPWKGLDPLSLPGIAERRVPALWRFRDRFKRWVGQPWKDVGEKSPLER